MIIYRIEHEETGIGPYIATGLSDEVSDMGWAHEDDDIHPTPNFDIGIEREIRDGERCGFSSLEQLHNWFTFEELDMLMMEGFGLVEIKDGHITATGENQVLFISEEDWEDYQKSFPEV